MDRILVTGSAGFIGFHLVLDLLNKGLSVTGLDCFNNYYPSSLKEMRNDILSKHENFTCLRIDIADTKNATEAISSGNFTHVCHLAAQAGVRYSLIDPMAYVSSNLVG